MIVLQEAQAADREKLWSIFQKYFYEMSAYYDMDMDAHGNYPYKYFDSYFEDGERTALFIHHDEILIGFAMINDHSCLGNSVDHAMAEFTIFPKYRERHLGMEAIRKIFAQYRGRWEIKYSNENKPARMFWTRTTREYRPVLSSHEGTESVLSFVVDGSR